MVGEQEAILAPRVFVSYSQRDRVHLEHLVSAFGELKMAEMIQLWSDQEIRPGDAWRPEIDEALRTSSIAVLLVSQAFLDSTFIAEVEVPALLESRRRHGTRILPVLLEDCSWKDFDWLREIQFLQPDRKPVLEAADVEAAMARVANEVRLLVRPVHALRRTEPVPLPPDRISIASLPTAHDVLIGRQRELEFLDAAWTDAGTNVVSVVAWGGSGKTALVSHWIGQLGEQGFPGANHVLAWSFQAQGEYGADSADEFLDFALGRLGDDDPARGSAWDRGERLAARCRAYRVLLLLDGLEAVQESPGPRGGCIVDPGVRVLVRHLAASNLGLCVITSRVPVLDLEQHRARSAPQLDLRALTQSSGAELLVHLGVRGTPVELEAAAGDFAGHCLALVLFGSFVAEYLNGDIARRDEVNVLDPKLEHADAARRMLASYEERLRGTAAAELLSLTAICGKASRPLIEALVEGDPLSGMTVQLSNLPPQTWKRELGVLRRAHLIRDLRGGQDTIWESHPLVREFLRLRLRERSPDGFRAASERLYWFYRERMESAPVNLASMEPTFAAIAHGCDAGRRAECCALYRKEIVRGEEFFIGETLGAFGAGLRVISYFFEQRWGRMYEELELSDQAFVFGEVAFYLQALGRPHDALEPAERSFVQWVEVGNDAMAANARVNQAEILMQTGQVAQALEVARSARIYADRSRDADWGFRTRAVCAELLALEGRREQAAVEWDDARRLRPASLDAGVGSMSDFRYLEFLTADLELCVLGGGDLATRAALLSAGAEALKKLRGETASSVASRPGADHTGVVPGLRALAAARASAVRLLCTVDPQPLAAELLDDIAMAEKRLVRTNRSDLLPRIRGLRAIVLLKAGRLEEGLRESEFALEEAERAGRRLDEIDAKLLIAELARRRGDTERTRHLLASVSHEIDLFKYHARDAFLDVMQGVME